MTVEIELVVTDLDNTLYDWVTFFASAFYEMIRVASRLLEVREEVLLEECRAVHQQYRDSEVPFALLDTPSVARRYADLTRQQQAKALDQAFYAFNRERDRTLKLYEGVYETLDYLSSRVTVVGHTEANVANAVFRLKKLGISRFIKTLYALEHTGKDHPDPSRIVEYRQELEKVRILPQHERKPNPQVLLDICKDRGVPVERTLYIGDSIARDIGMAKAAGAWTVWAKYGTSYDRKLWDKLVRITHWTAEDVARAQRAQELFGHASPDRVLHHSLSELLKAPSDGRGVTFAFRSH